MQLSTICPLHSSFSLTSSTHTKLHAYMWIFCTIKTSAKTSHKWNGHVAKVHSLWVIYMAQENLIGRHWGGNLLFLPNTFRIFSCITLLNLLASAKTNISSNIANTKHKLFVFSQYTYPNIFTEIIFLSNLVQFSEVKGTKEIWIKSYFTFFSVRS